MRVECKERNGAVFGTTVPLPEITRVPRKKVLFHPHENFLASLQQFAHLLTKKVSRFLAVYGHSATLHNEKMSKKSRRTRRG